MPLTKWCVEPVFLSRKPIPPDKTRINELECNNNNTLVGILRQLASLVKISDKIFNDLSEECREIYDRTLNLKFKVNRCESAINQLNAKAVKVPVGNLNAFIQIDEHFKSNKELSNNLFTTSTRPECIRDAYLAASITPLHIIRAIDSCRDDGRCGSKLFICQPVFANSKKKVNFDIETRRPASLVFAHELPRNVIIERAKTPLCNSHNVILNKEVDNLETSSTLTSKNNNNCNNRSNINGNGCETDLHQNPLYGLISPEEQMQVISQEFPSKYVPIDVTGVGFSRMSNLRRSLIHADFLIRRKKSTASKGKRLKRRNTICQTSNESSVNGNNENRKNRVRRRSVSSIDFVHTSCQTECNENEIYTSGRIVEVINCKNESIHALNNNNNNNDKTHDNYKRENKIKLKAEVHHYESRSLDNLIDSNHKHQSIGSDIPLMIDSNETEGNNTENVENRDKCKNESSVPISSLSVVMNTAVKMRENLSAKGVADDGRSSSGNWSASSSTHASVDSDHVVNNGQTLKNDLPHTLSNSSLGKDSVISDSNTTPHENDGRLSAQEMNSFTSDASHFNCENSNINRYKTKSKSLESSVSDRVVIRTNNSEIANKVQYANRDSESWLQYYDSSDTITETITPTPTESESGQTNRATNSCCDSSRRSSFSAIGRQSNDDEAESVYSVDNDGYYTSMHTDSGLFRVPIKLMITPNSSFRCKGKRDSITSNCTVGDISINSILSKTETESSTTTLTNRSSSSGRARVPPPPPPPRISSMLKSMRNSTISNKTNDSCSDSNGNTSMSSRSHSPSPAATNTSESDHSDVAQHNFKVKTIIDSSKYPSMCAITSTDNSDDNKSADSYSSDGSNRLTPVRKMLKSRSSSYKGFRIKDIFGFGHNIKDDRSSPLTIPSVPQIATIRRPQSPLRFNMYNNADGVQRFKRFAEKLNANSNTTTTQYQTPNIIRANAISSFSSDSNELTVNELNSMSNNSKSSNAIKRVNSDKKSDKNDVSETFLTASKVVPNPSPNPNPNTNLNSNPKPSPTNETVPKVPHNMLYPISRQVSIPIPRNDLKPLICAKPTTTSSISRPTLLSIGVNNSNANRSGARVTLDANGAVIYASNSLGRRRDGHPMNYLNQIQKNSDKIQDDQKCATLPKANTPRVSSPLSPITKPGALVRINPNGYIECTNGVNRNVKTQSSQPILSSNKTTNCGESYAKTSMSDKSNSHPNSAPVSRCVTPVVNKQKTRPTTPANCSSGLSKEGSEHKSPASVSFANKKQLMESDLSDFLPTSTSSPITPLSPRDNSDDNSSVELSADKSITNSTLQRRGRLTTEDLLIIIHNSKKKHNIKTEPEIIIANSPPSTRSQSSNSTDSPGSVSQIVSPPNTPSRTTQQFNGINSISDRRSWNGSESSSNSSPSQAGCRRSLASDRLGTNKPTTMNDFKRLLSQTRSNNFNTDRLSAAEILRANSKRPLTPVINCVTSFVGNNKKSSTPSTPSVTSATCAPPPQITGSISINTPNIIKPRIINGRSNRSPYRLESVCPPILEDCSEDTDDKKCANAVKQKMFASKVYKPVINNYNKVAANPQSTSTWV